VTAPSFPESQRKRRHVSVTLAAETIARLDDIAARWGVPRSQAIDRLVRELREPSRDI
jgi:hypothetical protein